MVAAFILGVLFHFFVTSVIFDSEREATNNQTTINASIEIENEVIERSIKVNSFGQADYLVVVGNGTPIGILHPSNEEIRVKKNKELEIFAHTENRSQLVRKAPSQKINTTQINSDIRFVPNPAGGVQVKIIGGSSTNPYVVSTETGVIPDCPGTALSSSRCRVLQPPADIFVRGVSPESNITVHTVINGERVLLREYTYNRSSNRRP